MRKNVAFVTDYSTPPLQPEPSDFRALTPRQQRLFDALVSREVGGGENPGKLARMYLGAVLVRNQVANLDAIPLAGHGLRELMEKLTRHLDVPNAYVAGLVGKVEELVRKRQAFTGAPAEARDAKQAEFVDCAEKLADWFPERHTPRKKWGSEVIDRLDPRSGTLPSPVKQPHIDLWNRCHKTFEDAAHHGSVPADVFDEHLRLLEDFLLERFKPPAVENQRAIEDIVREGETDA
jgi:hypothetical protein